MPTAGTIEEMVEKADLVVDCTPGVENKISQCMKRPE